MKPAQRTEDIEPFRVMAILARAREMEELKVVKGSAAEAGETT